MSEESLKFDSFDLTIIALLQRDAAQSQRKLAEQVGLSQNACWRRVRRLEEAGILCGTAARVSTKALGLDLTVFMMLKTRHHSEEWSQKLRRRVESIPEVIEFHRIGGEWDYLLKIVTRGMAGYDRVYQQLIAGFDHEKVTGYFSMETILESRPLPAPRK